MKIWKKPKDENRDHKNFLQHLAGNKQLSFDTFDVEEGTGKFDSSIEAENNSWLTIKKPKGRIPFNANLLTAGQVKFSNLRVSSIARDKLEQSVGSVYGSVKVYDAIYSMLETKRCANRASAHFHRPKILREHLKEVENASNEFGYRTTVGVHQYNVKWNELRGWLYGFLDESDVSDPIIESIIKQHGQVLSNSFMSMNPTTSILAALEVASSFQMHQIEDYGKQSNNPSGVPNSTTDEQKQEMAEELTEDVKNAVVEEIKDHTNSTERIQAGLEPIPEDITFDDLVNDQVDNQEAIKKAKESRAERCGAVFVDDMHTMDWTPSLDASSIQLDSAYDINSKLLGNTGHRLIRNSWRLPILGDPNVFKKNPITSAELITLVDLSGSMGKIDSDYSRLRKAADVVTAIQKRFGDSKAFGFTNPGSKRFKKYDELADKEDENGNFMYMDRHRRKWAWECDKDYEKFKNNASPLGGPGSRIPTEEELKEFESVTEEYAKDLEEQREARRNVNSALYPIIPSRFPDVKGGSTPLCGAMKGLEDMFQLHNARVLIITDGDANSCHSGDADDCVRTRAELWRNRGVRFASLIINSRYDIGSLPTDLSVHIDHYNGVTSQHINQVFNFLRG